MTVVDEQAPATETEPAPDRPNAAIAVSRCDVPPELAQMMTLAQVMANSGITPKWLYRTEDVVVVMLAARSLDVSLFWAMQAFHLVDGKLGMEASFMRALLQRAGGDYEVVENTAQRATIKVTTPAGKVCPPYTVNIGEYQHLVKNSKKPTWQNHPRAMLFARATSGALRMHCPGVLMGFGYTPDELSEAEAQGTVITATAVADNKRTSNPSTADQVRSWWMDNITDAQDMARIEQLTTWARERNLLDADLNGRTVRERILARAAQLGDAQQDGDDAGIDPDDSDADEADAEAEDATDSYQTPAAPIVGATLLRCGCDTTTAFETGQHREGCAEHTPPAPAADPRSRR